jgi:predicted kinase
MLILIFGLPGTGKTTLARAYAAKSGALHISSDQLRRELDLMGRYNPEDKAKVYATLLERTKAALLEGKTVVLDSTLYKKKIREPFQELAKECNVTLHWIEVRCAEDVLRERIKKPRLDSEADFAAYEKVRDEAELFEEPHLVLRSDSLSLEQMVDSAITYVNSQ